jgi:uncharacterized protein YecT (DUF1311 family)
MRLVVALTLLVSPSMTFATDWASPPTSLSKTCSASSQVEVGDCVAQAYKKADAALNEVWKKALATIQPTDGLTLERAQEWRDDLIAAQRAWNTFKDKDCNGARSFELLGGSGTSIAVISCLYEYTVTRTKDLEERYLQQ